LIIAISLWRESRKHPLYCHLQPGAPTHSREFSCPQQNLAKCVLDPAILHSGGYSVRVLLQGGVLSESNKKPDSRPTSSTLFSYAIASEARWSPKELIALASSSSIQKT